MCCGKAALSVTPNPHIAPNPLTKIPSNLRPNPSPHRHRHTIPNHPVSIVVTPRESEPIRHPLQPGILSDRVRTRAAGESPVSNQSRAQVLRVMSHASWCNVSTLGIADNRPVTISPSEATAHIVRNVRRRIRLEYLRQSNCPLRLRLALGKASPAADYD